MQGRASGRRRRTQASTCSSSDIHPHAGYGLRRPAGQGRDDGRLLTRLGVSRAQNNQVLPSPFFHFFSIECTSKAKAECKGEPQVQIAEGANRLKDALGAEDFAWERVVAMGRPPQNRCRVIAR